MRYELLGDRVLVRVIESRRTSSGLYIPEIAEGTPWKRAEVVEVGTGRLMTTGVTVPLQVAKGDIVLFFRNNQPGDQLVVPDHTDPNEELLVIREGAVLTILRDLEEASALVGADGKAIVLQ